MNAVPPLSLYIHFPWCVSKCPYCDFNSHALKDALPETGYIDALLADAAVQAPRVAGRRIGTVFLGGGTPSLFTPAAMARLFDGLRRHLLIDEAAEITEGVQPNEKVILAPETSLRDGLRVKPIVRGRSTMQQLPAGD